jgi:molybdenum cofactor biosynthesis enzyme MoaA
VQWNLKELENWLDYHSKGNSMALNCKEPFYNIEIAITGDVFLCCQTWHPKVIGNLLKNSLEEIWLGEEARKVRASIIDQTYTYCNLDICPAWISKTIPTDTLINDDLPGWETYSTVTETQYTKFKLPKVVKFSFDASCNLQCPSCRTEKKQYYPTEWAYERSRKILDQIKLAYLSQPNTADFNFTITGSGDAIGSHLYRTFLTTLDGSQFPNMGIIILTNGVMLTEKVINQLSMIHSNIKDIVISVDAATTDTYNLVRKGGDFDQLKENIEYLNQCPSLSHANLKYTYVVQQDNFREMNLFTDWLLKYPRSQIRFTRMVQFGAQSVDHFNSQNLWDPNHKDHTEFFEYINQSWITHPRVNWSNIQQKPSVQTLHFRRNFGET